MSKASDRRASLFDIGADAFARVTGDTRRLYVCPICTTGYERTAAVSGTFLTLEHVPPRTMHGREIVLTCRTCNSEAGQGVDAALHHLRDIARFHRAARGQGEYTGAGEFDVNGVTLNVGLRLGPAGHAIEVHTKRNSPTVLDAVRREWQAASGLPPRYSLSPRQRLNVQHSRVGFLKSAYLAAFAVFGYSYGLRSRLDAVRQQILSPDSEIVQRYVWLAADGEVQSPMMLLAHEPLPTIVVRISYCLVLLPWVEGPTDFYDAVPAGAGAPKRMELNVTGDLLKWPRTLIMASDFSYPKPTRTPESK